MKEDFKHKIARLTLENFTCFPKLDIEFSSGINLFIGENGTGKTHVLKVLYALLREGWLKLDSEEGKKMRVGVNFMEIFKFDKIKEINELNYQKKLFKSKIYFQYQEKNKLDWIFFEKEKEGFIYRTSIEDNFFDNEILFIPTVEMLTLSLGFTFMYERRETAFDGTYYDLAKKLSGLPLKNGALDEVQNLLNDVEPTLNAKVYKENEQFYLKFDNLETPIPAKLAAEGIKKLAQMIYLIKNGSLTKNTILFWDEPETNLNPRYIKLIVKFLQTLAKNGVQIFIATHDYLLSYWLSLAAEYPSTDTPPMRFFSFYKAENGTAVETAENMNGLKNNAILEEFGIYHDLMMTKSLSSLTAHTPQ